MALFKMQFVLKGFSQDKGLRTFTFEGIAEDRSRTSSTRCAPISL